MKKLVWVVMFIVLVIGYLPAQLSNLQGTLFSKADQTLQELEVAQAKVLSPQHYAKALDSYNEARTRFERKKSLKSIQKLLNEFNREASLAKKISLKAKTFFATTLAKRDESIQVKADEYAPDLFAKAEEKFMDASENFEKNDLNDAQKKAMNAEQFYAEASLKAVKSSLLNEARIFLREAKNIKADNLAPKTYSEAWRLLREVEEKLQNNYTGNTKAQELAERATYESKHSIELAKAISKIKRNPSQLELLFLVYEQLIENIGAEFNYIPKFDGEFERDLKKIQDDLLLSIKNLKDENLQLKKEIETLKSEKENLESELGSLQSQQEKVQAELKAKKVLEEKIRNLEKMFTGNEAYIVRAKDRAIVRLYGLSFPSGKSDILPQYFQLLTRVQRAIRELPVKKVIIEGHTDAIGNDSYNLSLSQNRAEAVRSYLLANMGLEPDFIEAIGYGKSKPIAPNDTKENRAKNRRIDVILILKGINLQGD